LRIALLEDHEEQALLLKTWLYEAGHACNAFATAKAFLREIGHESYDMFLLDWEIPDQSGFDVLRWVRANIEAQVPIMFVTAREEEHDIVAALEAGADDYLVKPLRKREFMARIGALERRTHPATVSKEALDLPPFHVDTQARTISRHGSPVELTQKEYELALFLFRHAGQLVSRGHILETIWGLSPEINTRTVDTHMSRIRSKLGLADEPGWRLSSVYLYGYRLERQPQPQS
jgi:two-component system response regulator RegX3